MYLRKKSQKERKYLLYCITAFKAKQGVVLYGVFFSIFVSILPADISESAIEKIEVRYGMFAANRFKYYNELLNTARDKNITEKLKETNEFWNILRYRSDMQVWKKNDYWATPYEMLIKGHGDCEDYVVAKYYTLTRLGVDPSRLYFVYVKVKERERAHMVLAYYPSAESEPLIMDNMNTQLFPASKRKDITPVYLFNREIFKNYNKSAADEAIEKNRIRSKLEDLVQRIQRNPL